jgi:hypothetical protein
MRAQRLTCRSFIGNLVGLSAFCPRRYPSTWRSRLGGTSEGEAGWRGYESGELGRSRSVDQGLVLLAAWAELGVVVAVLAYFVLRGRGP